MIGSGYILAAGAHIGRAPGKKACMHGKTDA